jgi:uncharacterized protein (UPF0548 family)
MNWAEIGNSWVSGHYTIHRNGRGRFSVWYHGDKEPMSLGQNIEEFERAKTLAKNHRKQRYAGVAIDASARG